MARVDEPVARPIQPAGMDLAMVSPRVRVITDDMGFDEIGPAWARLHESVNGTAFESFEWQRNWWRHFGGASRGCSLHLLVVEIDGVVAGIAPLMVRSERVLGPIRLRTLQFLAPGISDYLGILCAGTHAITVANAIACHLADVRFDVLLLRELRDRSGVSNALLGRLRRMHWTASREDGERCPCTVLKESWEETLKGLSASHRKRLSYLQRRLGKEFAVEFHRVSDPLELDAAMSTMMSMHQQHWVSAAFSGAFHDSDSQRFHLDTARAFLARGWLVLAFLRLNGEVAASIYAFKVGGSLQFYLSGRGTADEFVKYSPGLVVHLYCMQEMIREGVREYDFLRGTEPYKYTLGAEDVMTWGLVAFKPGSHYAQRMRALAVRVNRLVKEVKALRRSLRKWRGHAERQQPLDSRQQEE